MQAAGRQPKHAAAVVAAADGAAVFVAAVAAPYSSSVQQGICSLNLLWQRLHLLLSLLLLLLLLLLCLASLKVTYNPRESPRILLVLLLHNRWEAGHITKGLGRVALMCRCLAAPCQFRV